MYVPSRLLHCFFVLALICMAGACTPAVVKSSPLPPPMPLQEQTYRIGTGDEVEFRFFYTPELNQVGVVRPDGSVNLMLVGDTQLAGLTVEEARQQLVERYSSELKHPDITVNIRTFASRLVFIGGEVQAPGMRRLPANASVTQAIMDAGGARDTARLEEVVVIRRADNAEGRKIYTVNLEKVFSGEDLSQDILLQPMDSVYIPRTDIANFNLWVEKFLKRTNPVNVNAGYAVTRTIGGSSN